MGHWYVGEVVPRECVMNALPTDDCSCTLSSLEFCCTWEALWGVLIAEHAIQGGVPAEEPLMEEEEEKGGRGIEEDQKRGFSSAGGLAPRWVPLLECAMPTGPRFWHPG